jgi:hypothetical protein
MARIPYRVAPSPASVLALEVLAHYGSKGCTEALMMAHGFSFELMMALVRSGFACFKPEHIVSGTRTMNVMNLRITNAGRGALRAAMRQ